MIQRAKVFSLLVFCQLLFATAGQILMSQEPVTESTEATAATSDEQKITSFRSDQIQKAASEGFLLIQNGSCDLARIQQTVSSLKAVKFSESINGLDKHQQDLVDTIIQSLEIHQLRLCGLLDLKAGTSPVLKTAKGIGESVAMRKATVKSNAKEIATEFLVSAELANNMNQTTASFRKIMGEKERLFEEIRSIAKENPILLDRRVEQDIEKLVNLWVEKPEQRKDEPLGIPKAEANPVAPNLGEQERLKRIFDAIGLGTKRSTKKDLSSLKPLTATIDDFIVLLTKSRSEESIPDLADVTNYLDAIPFLGDEVSSYSADEVRVRSVACRLHFWNTLLERSLCLLVRNAQAGKTNTSLNQLEIKEPSEEDSMHGKVDRTSLESLLQQIEVSLGYKKEEGK